MSIIKNTQDILEQVRTLVSSLSEDQFISELKVLNGSTIGQHVRHMVEFYIELYKGCKTGIVSYDDRVRDLKLESDQKFVLSNLDEISYLCGEYDLERSLIVVSNHGNISDSVMESRTSFMRELVYAADHTVHHLAIVKIAMKIEFPSLVIPENVGVAPSTIRYRETACAQ